MRYVKLLQEYNAGYVSFYQVF